MILVVETLAVEFPWFCLFPNQQFVSPLKILYSFHPGRCCPEFPLSRYLSSQHYLSNFLVGFLQHLLFLSVVWDLHELKWYTKLLFGDYTIPRGLFLFLFFGFFFELSVSIKILACICSQLYGSTSKDSCCVFKSSSPYIRHRSSAYEPTPPSRVGSFITT